MLDIGDTIAPKSDQLNSDDLLCGEMTVKITDVRLVPGDLPVAIHYEGDNGRPYKPCKSMRRVLVHGWSRDGAKYVGRRLTLFRDPEAMYGGMKVGGIRISHMSHLKAPLRMALTERRGVKKIFAVEPLPDEPAATFGRSLDDLKVDAEAEAAKGLDDLKAWWDRLSRADQKTIKPHMDTIKAEAARAAEDPGEIEAPAETDQQEFLPPDIPGDDFDTGDPPKA